MARLSIAAKIRFSVFESAATFSDIIANHIPEVISYLPSIDANRIPARSVFISLKSSNTSSFARTESSSAIRFLSLSL